MKGPASPEVRSARQERDLQLWKAWKADPTPATLTPVLEALSPLVDARLNDFRGLQSVPPGAMRGYCNGQLMEAIQTYDPSKGAALATHAEWRLKKLHAFVTDHQNLGKIPEHRTRFIQAFKNAQAELTEELGHKPDTLQLAERLKWSQAEVGRMAAELRPDHIASISLEPDQAGDTFSAKERDALRYIHQQLGPQERLVFEHTLGVYGKQELPAKEIAALLDVPLPKVSRIRKKISNLLKSRGI